MVKPLARLRRWPHCDSMSKSASFSHHARPYANPTTMVKDDVAVVEDSVLEENFPLDSSIRDQFLRLVSSVVA